MDVLLGGGCRAGGSWLCTLRIGVASGSGSLIVGVKGGAGERLTTHIDASVVCWS